MSQEKSPTDQQIGSASLRHPDIVQVYESPPEIHPKPSKRSITLPEGACLPPPTKPKGGRASKSEVADPYLIIGFDTEFKTPDYLMNRDQIVAGEAKYRVLSYQFHAKTTDGREWQGICCPEGDDRMSLAAFIVFVLGSGVHDHDFSNLPTKIYLVGHFTRADIPAFSDFKDLTAYMSNVRNTFVSIDTATSIAIDHGEGKNATNLRVMIRDTMLLTPQAARSLKEIGKLVGHPKMVLDPDPARHKEMIRNMDRVRAEQWDLFKRYALNDATICVRYIEQVIAQFESVTGLKKVPVTLTSIGIELLLKTWREKLKLEPLDVLGKEKVVQRVFNKKLNRYVVRDVEVDIEQISWHLPLVTECYHGGRNEQFWFGPGFEDAWTDFDLSSAYPTAMSLIGLPLWREAHYELDATKYTATTLGFANVDFEFPPETRFPTLPVRTQHGLVFPLKGKSNCAAPELVAALALGATIKINIGVIVPTDPTVRIFGEFIKECLDQRESAGKKTLQGLFWKEISNSTYGKTAQGLRSKRVYDLRSNETKELPPSRITNPFFAAYITSFTRGVLGEIINGLEPDVCVFSCTTDGFLTNASASDIEAAQGGVLCSLFAEARKHLTGQDEVLEKKHSVRRLLGWRTRGQATLVAGVEPERDDTYNVVLAKGGIFTPPEFETVEDQNDEIVKTFFVRTPESMIHVEGKTGVRDMVAFNADLVEKIFSKRLNMEYDWKRKPYGTSMSGQFDHLVFSTRPWEAVEQFDMVRAAWENYTNDGPECLKTMEDFERFADHVEVQTFLSDDRAKYMKKKGKGDIERLRQMLCSAWRQSKAGLEWQLHGLSAAEFARILSEIGIPCKKTDVENGKKKPFIPNACPPTDEVERCLEALVEVFPALDVEAFLFRDQTEQAITLTASNDCQFVKLVA